MLRALLSFVTVAAVGATTLLLGPAPAAACGCGRPGVEVVPTNAAKILAPTHTEIRVTIWVGEVKLDEASIVVTPVGKTVKPVAVDRVAYSSASQRVVVLRPKAPLAPDTRYEVRAAAPGGGKSAAVGEFHTAAGPDEKPPEWSGIGKTGVYQPAKEPGTCATGEAWAQLDIADADKVKDDASPLTTLVYGVWLDDGKAGKEVKEGSKKAESAGPPLALLRPWSGGKLILGRRSLCQPGNFVLPKLSGADAKAKKGKNELKLRIAPIDLAGHVGKPFSVTVDLTKVVAKDPE
jgi:hypothetical protein